MKLINFQQLKEKVKDSLVGVWGWNGSLNQAQIPNYDLKKSLKEIEKNPLEENPSLALTLKVFCLRKILGVFGMVRMGINKGIRYDIGNNWIPKWYNFMLRAWEKDKHVPH